MSIVKMKKLRLMGLTQDRDAVLQDLMRLGCAEITGAEDRLSEPEWGGIITTDDNRLNEARSNGIAVKAALDALDKYAPEKKGLFYQRPLVTAGELFDAAATARALDRARQINDITRTISGLYNEENRLNNRAESLQPWTGLDLPLETSSTKEIVISFGVTPSNAIAFDELKARLTQAAPASELYLAHTDSEQHYMLFVCHVSEEEEALGVLKPVGFSRTQFKEMSGTAAENLEAIKRRIGEIKNERTMLETAIAGFKDSRRELERCADQITQWTSREAARENLLKTEKAFYLEGWIMAPALSRFEKMLSAYDCAYELSDPGDDDNVPIKLQNSRLIEPFNMVTEMYTLPTYKGIDPNPLFALFFAAFFGFMYADMGYGIILVALSIFIRRKVRLRGTMKYMFELMTICGVTAFIFGALFGGMFGDAVQVICANLFGINVAFPTPILWNPLEKPMETLILAIVIGAVQIIVGMCIKVYMCFRDGKPLDALFDVGSWWVVFVGIAVAFMKGNPWILIIGALMIILTQGRESKSIPGKLIGGLAKLYDITSYLSDVLSYSRLMALMLASSVIASVVNILGTMTGTIFIVGPIIFIVIFIFGHLFNMGINIIGTYVHAARLQYLEYFSKFYEGGGTPFRPLKINTKFVDIIEEEI